MTLCLCMFWSLVQQHKKSSPGNLFVRVVILIYYILEGIRYSYNVMPRLENTQLFAAYIYIIIVFHVDVVVRPDGLVPQDNNLPLELVCVFMSRRLSGGWVGHLHGIFLQDGRVPATNASKHLYFVLNRRQIAPKALYYSSHDHACYVLNAVALYTGCHRSR